MRRGVILNNHSYLKTFFMRAPTGWSHITVLKRKDSLCTFVYVQIFVHLKITVMYKRAV